MRVTESSLFEFVSFMVSPRLADSTYWPSSSLPFEAERRPSKRPPRTEVISEGAFYAVGLCWGLAPCYFTIGEI